jgi:hypothetical protein
MTEGIFHELLVRLPSLKCPFLKDCRFLELKANGATVIKVNMPYTAFENLALIYTWTPDLMRASDDVVYIKDITRRYRITHVSYLKVSTLLGDVYYALEERKLHRITFSEYTSCIKNSPRNTHIWIHCKSIKRLQIKTSCLNAIFNPDNAFTT